MTVQLAAHRARIESEPAAATIEIDVADVSIVFNSPKGQVVAADRVSFQIRRGEFVCLLGPSGCGKSTVLNTIAGFETPYSGTVRVAGKPVTGPGPDRGMVFQDYGLFPWLTVRGNIAFGPAARGKSRAETAQITDRFVTMMGLDRFANVFPHQLSGGMKQRVAIGRVLANEAHLALMDEPFGALDAMTRERLQDELLEIWRATGLSVVFVTHSLEEAIFLADRIVVMSPGPGRIIAEERITLERPRDVSSPAFNDIRRHLAGLLHSDHAREAA